MIIGEVIRMSQTTNFKTQTLEQKAYEEIKSLIISGKYPPGSYITEATLVKDLKMSRTPIRRALIKLEASGLIKHHSHKGSMVRNFQITMIEIINLLEFRLYLGRGTIDKAKRKSLVFPIEELKTCLKEMRDASLNSQDQGYFLKLNEFHNLLLFPSKNDLMIETVVNLQKRFILGANKYFELRKQGIPSIILKYHELISYLEDQEFDKASELLTIIIKETIQDLL